MITLCALLLAVSPPADADPRMRADIDHGAPARRADRRAAPRAGDPVTLDRGFFLARDVGGVGREPAVYTTPPRRVIIVSAPAPRSAGAQAAGRGLARPSD
ncbi:MAG: hypothetical protein RKE49_03275 [Oceanicaulis sp.]